MAAGCSLAPSSCAWPNLDVPRRVTRVCIDASWGILAMWQKSTPGLKGLRSCQVQPALLQGCLSFAYCSHLRIIRVALTAVTLHSNRGLVPLPFQHCPRFHCKVIALKSRTFVVKSRTKFPRKFVRGLNAKHPIVPSRSGGVSPQPPRTAT
jgi:hypothetical protein